MDWSSKVRVAITGVAGLIGGATARGLLEHGHAVVGVDDFSAGYADNVPSGVCVTELDCMHREGLTEVFLDCDAVVHTACLSAEGYSLLSPGRITSSVVGLSAAVVAA